MSFTAKIIPWLEVSDATKENLTAAIAGITYWSKVTDTAIVSSDAGSYGAVYEHLNSERLPPKFQIIPGLKGASFQIYPPIEEPWTALAQAVETVRTIHWTGTVLLDMEGLFHPYHKGEYDISLTKVREGVSLLPSAHYWWWPAIMGKTAARQNREAAMIEVAGGSRSMRFFHRQYAKPTSPRSYWRHSGAALTRFLAQLQPLAMIYCYGPEHPWPWQDLDIMKPIEMCKENGEIPILYPGAKHWVDGAENMSKVIVEARG
jgi:hypothetical protein